MIICPDLLFPWLVHGFGLRDSVYPADMTTVQQIHSAKILDACGRKGERIGEGDAIVSSQAGVLIGVRTADCVPILLVDEVTRTVAAVHAGWRGTAENIVGATVARLTEEFGSRPDDLIAAIGPSIGPCCYSVGTDVARHFDAWIPELRQPEASLALDLPGVNQIQLEEAGVRKIWKSGECTFCLPDRFFSFRREKEQAGRMLSFAGRVG